MADNSFTIGARQFKLRKIHAMKQYHIVRRIAPILAEFLPVIQDIVKLSKDKGDVNEAQKFEQIALLAAPLLRGLSKLSDKDSDHVLYGLLTAVEMQQDGMGWARLSTGEQLMFDDLSLPILLQAAGRSFLYNLSDFFDVLPRV